MSVGSRQGIRGLQSGVNIGGTIIKTGSGSPASVVSANRIGDLYVDYTNGVVYIASATGTGSWISIGGNVAAALKTASTIGGTTINAHGASLTTAPIPTRIGDLLINYATGKLYIAGGVSATTDWNLVTSA